MGKLKASDIPGRVLLHIPVGIMTVLFLSVHWSLVLAFTYMFYKYELNDDRHTKDQAWKDLFGWLIGAGIAGIGFIIYRFI